MSISKTALKIHRNNGGEAEVQNTFVIRISLLTLRKLGLLWESETKCVWTL